MFLLHTKSEPKIEVDKQFIRKMYEGLLDDQPMDKEDRTKFFSFVKEPEGLEYLYLLMLYQCQKVEITGLEVFETFKDIVNLILEANNENVEPGQLCALLNMGSMVIFQIETSNMEIGHTKYLRNLYSNHKIWSLKHIWEKILDFKVERTLSHISMMASPKKQDSEKESPGFLSRLVKAGSAILRKSSIEEAKQDATRRGVVFSELTSLLLEMAFMGIDLEYTRVLIITICTVYKIDSDKLYQLLSDYESAQILPREVVFQGKERVNK